MNQFTDYRSLYLSSLDSYAYPAADSQAATKAFWKGIRNGIAHVVAFVLTLISYVK